MSDSGYIGRASSRAFLSSYTRDETDFRYFSTDFEIVTTSLNLVKNYNYFVDTTGSNITLTLPANPEESSYIFITDVGGNLSLNNMVVEGNGQLIMGLAEDMTVDENYSKFCLMFIGSSYGWVLR